MSTTALISVEEFDRLLPEDDGQDHELLEGEHLVSPYPKSGHTRLQKRIAATLDGNARDGAEAFIEMGYRLSDHSYLRPDVSLATPEQAGATPAGDWFRGSPLIAVEVVSPSNTAHEIAARVNVYLHYGAREVWGLYPEQREMHVHAPDGLTHRYRDRVLSAALPSLSLTLDGLFAGLTY